MCADWEGVKPDIVSVAKAMSGGMMPVSAAFCNNEVI
jgi:ornithine--oxo-acid transaminase